MKKKNQKTPLETRPISSKELKFWLKGILEFQEDSWVPNPEQWASIKNKIFNLVESDQQAQNNTVVQTEAIQNRMPVARIPERPTDDFNDLQGEPLIMDMVTPQLPASPSLATLLEKGGAEQPAGNFPSRIVGSNTVQGVSQHSKARNLDSSHGYRTDFK